MKVRFKQIAACCAFICAFNVPVCAVAQQPPAKTPQSEPAKVPPLPTGLAVAKQEEDSYGNELLLPDGSVIKLVWPTALCVVDTPDRPWPNEPCAPSCEPAIYSLARVLPSGQQLWAKSYIERSEELHEACAPDKSGFTIKTHIVDIRKPFDSGMAYLKPYDGTFFLGIPGPSGGALASLYDADTGEPISKPHGDIRTVDAEWLRQVKQKIWDDLNKRFPDKKHSGKVDFKKREKLFRAVEEAVFTQANAHKP
jgi:hypothetical protein